MELPQFTTRKALEVTIAMLSVVAVQLLRLRDLSRKDDGRKTQKIRLNLRRTRPPPSRGRANVGCASATPFKVLKTDDNLMS